MTDLVKIEGDEIVIRVPVSAMATGAPYAFDARWGPDHGLDVGDVHVFAKELVTELRRESETGITLVHRMLDQACVAAVENGAEGLTEASYGR